MNHAADVEQSRRREASFGPIAVLCGFLAACGTGASGPVASGPSAAPPGPTAPSPSPSPTSTNFLHVLQGHSLVTYRIDDATGRLQLAVTQDAGDARALTGAPGGRFVYAVTGDIGSASPAIVAYIHDEQGRLLPVSEMSVWGAAGGAATDNPCHSGWVWLSASSGRVYALWFSGSAPAGACSETNYTYLTSSVTIDGQLGPPYAQSFLDDADLGLVAVDVHADVFYKAGNTDGTLIAHVVEPDGRLTQMGASRLCGTSSGGYLITPLLAVRGFVFGAWLPHDEGGEAVCSWEGLRLAPRAKLTLRSGVATAFVPPSDAEPALVAMSNGPTPGYPYPNHHEVQLFSMGPDGGLQLLDKADAPEDVDVAQLVFHPSGRFLYVSYRTPDNDHLYGGGYVGSGLRAYSIGSDGRLEMIENLNGAGGYVSPFFDRRTPIMAVSTRAIIPRL
jgi:hypothetical protein